jgi:hypothetical protein
MMRLTLRTLLAWLDDTLSPGEVREIGKQVAESPFAQELVDRIHRVTRQRRLTVPGSTGPDATDPNLVASYLDNELDQDLVPEYEKLCLTSDVHMAEVASVHQILSLIGQKAKVPPEARQRMYHLIRGREALTPKPGAAQTTSAAPVSEPILPWVTPPPPSRLWIERYGPAAAALLLIILLGWSAWMSVRPATESAPELAGPVVAKGERPGAEKAAAGAVTPPAPVEPAHAPGSKTPEVPGLAMSGKPDEAQEPTTGVKTEGTPEKRAGEEGSNPAAPRVELPPGAVGTAEKSEGVLLRFDPERREWVRLEEPTALRSQDRLLDLDPFRSTVVLGTGKVDLVGETEVWISSPPPDEAARFQLAQGRVALHGGAPALPFEIQFAGKNILITPPAGSTVGVERISRFEPGNTESSSSMLRFYSSEGDVALAVDDAKETLTGPGWIAWDGSRWADKADKPPPNWVTETKPTAFEQQIGEQFLRYFRPNRPVITDMVEALADDQKDVRRLAIRALRSVGDLSFVVPLLNRADDPTSRREAIRVLRAALAQGPDAVKAVHDQLLSDLGEEQAKDVERLLIGFTPKEARDEATFTNLVQQLKANYVGVRELALDNLRTLTGRDDLEYDPDKPEGRGQRAWSDLLRDHELRPAVPVGKAEK